MRANVEKQLDLIAKGKCESKNVLEYVLKTMERKFHYYVNNINLMDTLMDCKFTSVASTGKPFSKCGKCRR